MKIAYDDIITKANQRKEALKDFAERVEGLEVLIDYLEDAAVLAMELTASYKELDAEAKKMLPPGADMIAGYLGHEESLRKMVISVTSSGAFGYQALYDTCK